MNAAKTSLITGSTSGIGIGIARGLAAAGHDVVLNGFGDPAAIETLRTGLAAEFGVRVLCDGADMSDPDAIRAMIARCEADLGRLDVLVNNAGIQHVAPIDEFPRDKLDAILAIHLVSNLHTIGAALPGMKKRGWGRIINIASAHALVASPFKSAYVAAKHGQAGLTKTVALEVAEMGITCAFHGRRALIPRDRGHSFHGIAGSHSGRRRASGLTDGFMEQGLC